MQKTSLYVAMKSAPNKSVRLTGHIKRNPYQRIYAYGTDETTRLELANMSLKEMRIDFGHGQFKNLYKEKIREISGRSLRNIIHASGGSRCLVGLNHWCIDITDRFIKEYNLIGPCAFSDSYHQFENKSTKTRSCKFCGQKQKSKIVITKKVEWVNV